jgi:PKD repeat protein
VARFDAPDSFYQFAAVPFTDGSEGGATAWSWTFGDGQGSQEQSPEHRYETTGTFTVTLTVTNEWGSSTAQRTIRIDPLSAPAPVVQITGATATGPNSFTAPANTNLVLEDIAEAPPLTEWRWTMVATGEPLGDARLLQRSFTAGTYVIRLVAENPADSRELIVTLVVT